MEDVVDNIDVIMYMTVRVDEKQKEFMMLDGAHQIKNQHHQLQPVLVHHQQVQILILVLAIHNTKRKNH